MDTSETTSKLVENTYKNIIEELGPCIKQLVVVGRTYLKSMHGMVAACGNYNSALSRIASMADNSTLRGSSDLGSALHHLVDINKELIAQQSNIMKSLEFDFLAHMETAADKDTRLIEREQKRFQQMHRRQREEFAKCFATLKKSRRKKSINTDRQLTQMKLLENAKTRLEEFCDQSLQEAILQERMLYGTVLERQCALNKQWLIYHNKGLELLQDNITHWESLAKTSDVLPNNCFPLKPAAPALESQMNFSTIESLYRMDSPVDTVTLRNSNRAARESVISTISRFETANSEDLYGGTIIRAKSEHNLSTISTPSPAHNASSQAVSTPPPPRFSRIIEYNGEATKNYVRALYPYEPTGSYQMKIQEGDVIEFLGEENATGWQFGDNLSSRKSGWFPLSYTERITNGHTAPEQTSNSNGSAVRSHHLSTKRRPLPPTPPNDGASSLPRSSHMQQLQRELGEYGTLKKAMQGKLVPVSAPNVEDGGRKQPSLQNHTGNTSMNSNYGALRYKTDPSQGQFYSGHLQSMHL